ncbi:MAG TPA: twin-arginine translocase TatA/TatE family subunit [Kiritimatiellia bacterium]|nr:twin-arginine translocase TatA/TatE family subunit [Kiritimatiellia bacterium]HMO97479.1 twin-arginine translocase TatA/TatE family subunit [Kiritimatiellia bacterium]HMP96288.1 twin-arginine translocase TatA/TatE family subunit [Kiritimatiellia bacterium]
MMRNFSVTEIVLILLALILLFGARRIPELARSLGRSLSEFKRGREDGEREETKPTGSGSPPPAA